MARAKKEEVETPIVVNATDVPTSTVLDSLTESPEFQSINAWAQGIVRQASIFSRDRFVTPTKIIDQMRTAHTAATADDAVSLVLESTEALAFSKIAIEVPDDPDEEDIWNQIAEDLDLDSRLREMWRELFTVSQFYVANWWGTKSYKVRGNSKDSGRARKRRFDDLIVPTNLTVMDPTSIVPVGNTMFNQEKLAYSASDRNEAKNIDEALANQASQDLIVKELIQGRYEASREEKKWLSSAGINASNLFLLDTENVWRHTATRPQYQRWADIRLRSIFELLDLKQQLRQMDRTHLLGAANFIVLIRKGTDTLPAVQTEVDSLRGQWNRMAQMPVVIGDHRLSIEIITPKTDVLLNAEKYDVIDRRIIARLYLMLQAPTGGQEDSIKLARVISRGMESRRHMIRRSLELRVLKPIYERNDALKSKPKLRFYPKQIALDFDPGLAAALQDLRDRREIARATLLENYDLSESTEAQKLLREKELYDDVFNTLTALPDPDAQVENQLKVQKDSQKFSEKMAEQAFERQKELPQPGPPGTPGGGGGSSPAKKKPTPKQDPKSAGRGKGGNRSGGGAAPGTGQGQERDPRRRAKG